MIMKKYPSCIHKHKKINYKYIFINNVIQEAIKDQVPGIFAKKLENCQCCSPFIEFDKNRTKYQDSTLTLAN